MKPTIRLFIALFIMVVPIAFACGFPAQTGTHIPAVSITQTSGPAPAVTATPEPSLAPAAAVLDLEIIEWSEWPYANLADPSNTDTHVEVLIRNPNDFPVRVNNDQDELRFINAAGEVVYANPSSFFYIWQGDWMLPGETAALSACVCFQSSGMEKQEWKTLELIAPLEIVTDIAYTPDVEVTLGEVIDLGGGGLGIETTLTNTSDQVLASIPHRVLARDASGRYVGVAFAGNAVVSFTENTAIQPGDSGTGINVSEINYIDKNVPLTYEVAAIGIPYRAVEVTAEAALPSGAPLANWNGIRIMPGAIAGEVVEGGYQFTTQADLVEITSFYETELSNLGFEFELNVDETAGQAIMNFRKDATTGMVVIVPLGGDLNGVAIIMNT